MTLRNRWAPWPCTLSGQGTLDVLWQAGWHLIEYLGSVWQGGTDHLQEVATPVLLKMSSHFFLCQDSMWEVTWWSSLRGGMRHVREGYLSKACFILLQSLLKEDCSRGLGDGSATAMKGSSSKVQLWGPAPTYKPTWTWQWILVSLH